MALLTHRFVATALLALCTAAQADLASDADLKTAFAYNFIVLSTWPAESLPVLRFCVAGAAAGSKAFHVLGGKPALERTLSVANISSPERAIDCQILYVAPAESGRLETWLAVVAGRPTLTISEEAQFRGAMVNLRKVGGRIVFDVDTRAADKARIVLSSQLIKLAASRQ
jgi:hypothetical protein